MLATVARYLFALFGTATPFGLEGYAQLVGSGQRLLVISALIFIIKVLKASALDHMRAAKRD